MTEFADQTTPATLDPRTAAIMVDRVLPARRQVVSDIGRFNVATWNRISPGGRPLIVMGAFGSIGLGLGGAVGAAIANPDCTTVAICGDAGFMMNVGELATVARERLRLVALVFNDGALGAEYFRMPRHNLPLEYALTSWPSLSELATAMGVSGIEISRPEHFADLERLVADPSHEPIVVDIRLDPDVNVVDWV